MNDAAYYAFFAVYHSYFSLSIDSITLDMKYAALAFGSNLVIFGSDHHMGLPSGPTIKVTEIIAIPL